MFSLCMFVVLMLNFGFNDWVFFCELRVPDLWSSVNVLKLSTFFFVLSSGFSLTMIITLNMQLDTVVSMVAVFTQAWFLECVQSGVVWSNG